MNLNELLQTLGLSDKQAKVYLACLKHEENSVLGLANLSGLKRSTCYTVLAELERKKLVQCFNFHSKKRYRAAEPSELLFHVEHQKQLLEQYLPLLKAIGFKKMPAFDLFTEHEGLLFLQKIMITAPHVYIIGSLHSIGSPTRNFILRLFSSIPRDPLKIHLRLTSLPQDCAFAEKHVGQFDFHFVPRGTFFDTLSIISEKFYSTFIELNSEMRIISTMNEVVVKAWWQIVQLMESPGRNQLQT